MSSISETPAAAPGQPETASSEYTAVVYFHGMGSQRRYEEVSRVVDSLDRFARNVEKTEKVGLLGKIKARLEPGRGERKEPVAYLHVTHQNGSHNSEFRFYEVYWAPLMAGAVSTREVTTWLLGRLATPARMGRTPWRLRPRVKRAALYRLWADLEMRRGQPVPESDLKALLQAYDQFEGAEARDTYRKGTFKEFLDHLRRSPHIAADRLAAVVALAKQWRRSHNRAEGFTLAMLATFLVVLLIGFLAFAALAAVALIGVAILFKTAGINEMVLLLQNALRWQQIEQFSGLHLFVAAVLTLVTLYGLYRIRGFLRDYVGDVQLWTTYEETNQKYRKRKEVLRVAVEMLQHVLSDKDCRRVAILSHSLGTTIAHDALLELGRNNRAHHRDPRAALNAPLPLGKIEHFITLGSPVDKVHYFFESQKSELHRYNRVVEELRGDLGEVPFAVEHKPHIHWINFWDRADLVSSSLETPCNKLLPHLRVDNCQVASYQFPDPMKSHSAYFEHVEVLRIIFAAIFNRGFSYQTAPVQTTGGSSDIAAQNVGPGTLMRSTPILQGLMLALPWLMLATILTHLTPWGGLQRTLLYSTAMVIWLLFTAWLFSTVRKHLKSINASAAGPAKGRGPDSTSSDVHLERTTG